MRAVLRGLRADQIRRKIPPREVPRWLLECIVEGGQSPGPSIRASRNLDMRARQALGLCTESRGFVLPQKVDRGGAFPEEVLNCFLPRLAPSREAIAAWKVKSGPLPSRTDPHRAWSLLGAGSRTPQLPANSDRCGAGRGRGQSSRSQPACERSAERVPVPGASLLPSARSRTATPWHHSRKISQIWCHKLSFHPEGCEDAMPRAKKTLLV